MSLHSAVLRPKFLINVGVHHAWFLFQRTQRGLYTVDRTTKTPVVCADLTENFGPWRHDHACFVLADISQAEAVPLFKFKTDTISIYFFIIEIFINIIVYVKQESPAVADKPARRC